MDLNKPKPIRLTVHARLRLMRYQLSEEEVIDCIRNPDRVVGGYRSRIIAHKVKNKHVIRAIFEETKLITVVTGYLAEKSRYERGA